MFDVHGEELINQLMGHYKSIHKTYKNSPWMMKTTKQMVKFAKLFGEEVCLMLFGTDPVVFPFLRQLFGHTRFISGVISDDIQSAEDPLFSFEGTKSTCVIS